MQRYAIINTCGREDCCGRERDPYGGYCIAPDVDARIAEGNAAQLRLCEEAQIAAGTIAQQGQRIAELEEKIRVARSALDNIYGWSGPLLEYAMPSKAVIGWIRIKAGEARTVMASSL